MNRRDFLKKLGLGAGAAAVAPSVLVGGPDVPERPDRPCHKQPMPTLVWQDDHIVGDIREMLECEKVGVEFNEARQRLERAASPSLAEQDEEERREIRRLNAIARGQMAADIESENRRAQQPWNAIHREIMRGNFDIAMLELGLR